jgi:hypothetical protein
MNIFGSVADRYETARPGYPPEVADAIADYHGRTPWMYHDVMAAGEFTDVQVERFRRRLPLTRDEYLALVSTFGPFLARPPEPQRQGLDALGRLVDDFGGTVTLDLLTTLTLGRAA